MSDKADRTIPTINNLLGYSRMINTIETSFCLQPMWEFTLAVSLSRKEGKRDLTFTFSEKNALTDKQATISSLLDDYWFIAESQDGKSPRGVACIKQGTATIVGLKRVRYFFYIVKRPED